MTRLTSILLAIFLIAYALSAFAIPLGLVVPLLALVTGILIILNVASVYPRQPRP